MVFTTVISILMVFAYFWLISFNNGFWVLNFLSDCSGVRVGSCCSGEIYRSSDVLVGIHVATKYRAALLLFLLVLYFLLSSL